MVVGHRHGLDPALLWLWRRLANAVPIRHLAWEPPYATGAALKRQKRQKKNLKTSVHQSHNKQCEKAAYEIGEIICKLYI